MAGTLGVKFGSFQNALCGTVTTLVLAVISAHVAAEIEQTRGHLETVEVTAQATNASNDIDHQRNADKIVAVQTSEAIGELPDANVSEALQRIPGVFISRDQGEGRFVGVRGIDPNLNAATLNGMSLPSPESDSRAVALDVIPSDLIASLEVFKTLTPDMSADSIGGAIEVKSINALEQKGRNYKLGLNTGYSELQGKNSPKIAVTFTDILELGGHELGIALAGSHQERKFGSETMETDGVWQPLQAKDGSNGFGAQEMEQRDYQIIRERTGFVANLDYRLSSGNEIYLHSLYSDYADTELRQRNSFKFDKGELQAISDSAATWSGATLEKSLKDRYESQKILSLIGGGDHHSGRWGVSYALGYSTAEETEPRRRDSSFAQKALTLGYTDGGRQPKLFTADATALDAAHFAFNELVIEDHLSEDEAMSLRIDIRRNLQFGTKLSVLKFGFLERRREKIRDFNTVVYDGFGGNYSLADFSRAAIDYGFGDFGPGVHLGSLNQFINQNLTDFEIDETETALASARDYVMGENITALYIMNRIEFAKASMTYGARYEKTRFNAAGFRAIQSEVAIDGAEQWADDVYISTVKLRRNYGKLFPSVNFKYAYNDHIVLRAAYTETLARPAFGDLNPSPEKIEYEEGELVIEAGNPYLKPYESSNLDTSFEYYADTPGMFSLGLFHKKIENFVVSADITSTTDFSDYVGDLLVNDAEVIRPINGDKARLTGIELSWTRGFDNGLLLRANTTMIDSNAHLNLVEGSQRSDKIALPEQADLVANVIVGYERDALSLRLSMAYKSERLVDVNLEDAAYDIYEANHLQFDFGAKYRFDNGLLLSFSAVNLTNEPLYRNNSGYNAVYEEYGKTYLLGVSFSSW